MSAIRLSSSCLVLLSAGAVGCVTGCGAARPDAAPTPPVATAATPTSAGDAGVVPAVSTSAPPPDGGGARPAPSPFVIVSQAQESLTLFPVDGALLALAPPDPVDGDEMAIRVGVVDGSSLVFPDRMKLPGWFHHVVAIVGRWPNDIDMLSVGDTGRTGIAERFVLSGNGWGSHSSDVGSAFVGATRLGNGYLGVQAPIMFGEPRFVSLHGATGPQRRFATPTGRCTPNPEYGAFAVNHIAVMPRSVGAAKNGTVVVAGTDCEGDLAFEVWPPGKTTSTVIYTAGTPFAGSATEGVQLLPADTDDALYVLAGRLLRLEGGHLVEAPAPSHGAELGAVAKDGTLYVLGGGRISRHADGGYEELPLPPGYSADGLAVDDAGTLWATANGTLLRTRHPGEQAPEGVAQATPAKKRVLPKVFELPRPGGPYCSTNLVVLYGFTKVTPLDYDFPLTRKALKGHTELAQTRFAVTEDGGRRFLTARTSSFAEAKKLVDIIEKGVQGAKPTVICKDPPVVRELRIDLRTGEVVPG